MKLACVDTAVKALNVLDGDAGALLGDGGDDLE